MESNHYRRALAQLTSFPADTPQYQLFLSRTQLGLAQFEEAMQSAEKALAADPENAAFHVQVAAVAGRTAEHASIFKQLSLAKRVKKELDEALALDPRNPDAIYGLMLFSDLAPSFMGGDKAKAQTLAEELTEISPSRGSLAAAALAHNRKDPKAEENLLMKAVAADPQSYEAHLALAVFRQKSDPLQLENADEQACEALYIDPARAEAWQILAELAALDDCLLDLDGILAAAQQFDPDNLSPAYSAAVALIGSGKHLDTAQDLLQRYLDKLPEGNAPSHGAARYQLALIAQKQGRSTQALDLLHAALVDDPTLEDARKELKRLEHPNRTYPTPYPTQ